MKTLLRSLISIGALMVMAVHLDKAGGEFQPLQRSPPLNPDFKEAPQSLKLDVPRYSVSYLPQFGSHDNPGDVAECRFQCTSVSTGSDQSPSSETANRQTALNAVMDDNILQENAVAVLERMDSMSPEQKYHALIDCVLPNFAHLSLRLALDFSQTDPAPLTVVSNPRNRPLEKFSASRIHRGGELISPVLDLIQTARALGRLTELRQHVESIPMTKLSDQQKQTALLAMIAIYQGDHDEAVRRAMAYLQLRDKADVVDGKKEPELVLLLHCVRNSPALCEVLQLEATELLQRSRGRNYDVGTRQLRAFLNQIIASGRAGGSSEPDRERSGESWPSGQWQSVTRSNAQSRGTGLNPSVWRIDGPQAMNIASHSDELLYFAVPMRNSFEVECDVTAFDWHDTDLLVAGHHVSPFYTHRAFSVADIRNSRTLIELPTRMSQMDHWMGLRTTVKNGFATTFFNGRRMHAVSVNQGHDPWVAVRSQDNGEGSVRNIQIRGRPEIPESLDLLSDRNLDGWLPYYAASVGADDSQWSRSFEANSSVLIGRKRREFFGSHREEVIHYHRPMLEDGAIEIEFFYRENETLVNPVLDRLCFLLHPDGVRIHWLTDGAFDRTHLAPDNITHEEANRRGPQQLPLRNNEWNQLGLTLTGDVVSLTLNKVVVFERELESTNQRGFGLFHYSDETEVRVRSIVWRGKWPRILPGLPEQDLANDAVARLTASGEKLPDVIHHDFATESADKMFVTGGSASVHSVIRKANGLHLSRTGQGHDESDYHSTKLSSRCQLHADFDVVVSFDDFRAEFEKGGRGEFYLWVTFDDVRSTHYSIERSSERRTPEENDNRNHILFSERRNGQELFQLRTWSAAEATAGKFWMARRGERLYFLKSDNDSEYFRILDEVPIGREDTAPLGVELICQAFQTGVTDVVLQDILLRAETILP